MNKGYLKKLIQYMKEVYQIENALKGLKDKRINPKYSTVEAILPVLFGFVLRIQSFNELKYRLMSNDFKNIISKKMRLPQIDTIRIMELSKKLSKIKCLGKEILMVIQ